MSKNTTPNARLHGGRKLPSADLSGHNVTTCSAFVGSNVAYWHRIPVEGTRDAWQWLWQAYAPTYNCARGEGRMLGSGTVATKTEARRLARTAAAL